MKHQLETTVDIDAPPEAVWNVLTDLDGYSDWNPFIVRASGTVSVGERLTNKLQPPGGKAMTFKPTVTIVEQNQSFEWLGRLGVPGIFDGRHRFELEATRDGTHVVHSEYFKGVLVRFMRKSLDSQTRQGFIDMNTALKARAEERAEGHAGVLGRSRQPLLSGLLQRGCSNRRLLCGRRPLRRRWPP